MKEEFASYEETLALKELGFDESCFGYYRPLKGWMTDSLANNPNWRNNENTHYFMYVPNPFGDRSSTFKNVFDEEKGGYKNIACPLYQQVFRWFRDKHDLHHEIVLLSNGIDNITYAKEGYIVTIKGKGVYDKLYNQFHDSYEEAEFVCLKELIEILKQKS